MLYLLLTLTTPATRTQTAVEATTGLQGHCWSICKLGVNPDLTFLVTDKCSINVGRETPQEEKLREHRLYQGEQTLEQ